jgi:hypothetical protein
MAADTFSNTLGVLLMGTGNDNNSWGNNANLSVFQIFEDAIANVLTSSVTGGTLDFSGTPPPTGPSQVRYSALVFTGVLTSAQIIQVPNLTKIWFVKNATTGAFALTFQTPAAVVSTPIPQNAGWQMIQCDGNNNIIVSPFNSQQIQMPDGSVTAPAFSDINETNSGWYRHGTQDWRLAINGADVMQATGPGASSPNVFNIFGLAASVLPSGMELAYAGVLLPTGFLWEFGQLVSRTTYPNLLTALRATFTGSFSIAATTTITVTSDLRNMGLIGAVLESATAGVTNLTITAITATTITISGNATANSGGNVTIFAYPFGNGDGVTTFGVPDRRGRVLAGRDDMNTTSGAAAAGRLTAAGAGINGIFLGAAGGSQTQTISVANIPSYTLGVSIPAGQANHSHNFNGASVLISGGGLASGGAGATFGNIIANTGGITTGGLPAMSGTAASGGSGVAISDTQPTGITNWIIKI